MLSEIIKTVVYLGSFIIVIILASSFTKFIAKKSETLGKIKNIKVIQSIPLNKNTRIYIIEIWKVYYIIYDNGSHIEILDKYKNEDAVAFLRDLEVEQKQIDDKFKNLLENLLAKIDKKNKD